MIVPFAQEKWPCPYKNQGCDLTKVKKSWKLGSRPGSLYGLEDRAPWTSWMCNFGGFTNSPHPHKQGFRHNTGYFSSFKKILRQRKICKKILKWGKIPKNHTPEEWNSRPGACLAWKSLVLSKVQFLKFDASWVPFLEWNDWVLLPASWLTKLQILLKTIFFAKFA